MALVISRDLSLSADPYADVNANNPVFGWENLVSIGTLTASAEQAAYPAVNLANPATNLVWKAPAIAETFVTVTVNRVDPVDYVGIARHNLGSAAIAVSVEGKATSGGAWTELVSGVLLADDGPALFRFTPQSLYAVRLRMLAGTAAPSIAVVYTGKLLIMARRVYVGHAPLPLNRKTKVTNNRSESGNFLGRIAINRQVNTSLSMANLPPSWVRSNLKPFFEAAEELPFFFAWRPSAYPREVGYCWLTGDPTATNALQNGFMQIGLSMGGIV
jgi:hypothetical protein